MTVIEIDGSRITNPDTFHDVFDEAFGFPDFYGRNMNAWIDCMTCLDEGDGMCSLEIKPGEMLTIHVKNYSAFKAATPEMTTALLECAAFVNYRRMDIGEPPILLLSFHT